MQWMRGNKAPLSMTPESESHSRQAAPRERWLPLLLACLLAAGVAIRLRQYLGCPSYWYDEAYLLINIFDRDFGELLGPLRAQVVMPPLFLWLLRGLYAVLGGSEWTMRLPAVACSMAALFLMFAVARRVTGRWGALLAVGLCAVSHHAMVHGNVVRPYSLDFLLTQIIVLLGLGRLFQAETAALRNAYSIGLLVAAGLAPWMSFPSVLVLGGVSLALLVDAARRREATAWWHWLGLNAVLAGAILSLWWFHARHLYYPGLHEHWIGWGGFPQDYTPATMLRWSVDRFVRIGDHGTTSLGIPLLLLALIGAGACWRRSAALAVLLSSPIVLGWLMALAGRYPMADRTVFYAVPCLWLLAVVGVEAAVGALPRRSCTLALLAAGVLLGPGIVRAARYLVVVATKVDFRSAFAFVDRHKLPADRCWISHPEVFEVYCQKARSCLGSHTRLAVVGAQARGQRLWVVAPPLDGWRPPYPQDFRQFLAALELRPTRIERFAGLDVVLFEPAAEVRATIP
ncbi:MAG: glycosyltransferase family 39 protein [Gemmataceae bacterium]|nr:glycosyltransferase family 39 protein [Gemmataceae bacterium]